MIEILFNTLLKKIFLAVAIILFIVWGIWIAFPVTAMESIIEDSVHNQNITIKVEGLKKGLFYRLQADRIALKSAEAEIISLHSVYADINPLRLIALRMDLSVSGRLGEGTFSGDAGLSKKMVTINLDFRQAHLKDMQFLTMAGIRGTGTISGKITLTGQKGHLEFLVNDAELEPMFKADVLIPLNFFRSIQASVRLEGQIFNIASVSLEGPDIFARLKGVIRDGNMDLQIELMPEKILLENPLFLSQVERYQVSPGYYVIPVKGPLVF